MGCTGDQSTPALHRWLLPVESLFPEDSVERRPSGPTCLRSSWAMACHSRSAPRLRPRLHDGSDLSVGASPWPSTRRLAACCCTGAVSRADTVRKPGSGTAPPAVGRTSVSSQGGPASFTTGALCSTRRRTSSSTSVVILRLRHRRTRGQRTSSPVGRGRRSSQGLPRPRCAISFLSCSMSRAACLFCLVAAYWGRAAPSPTTRPGSTVRTRAGNRLRRRRCRRGLQVVAPHPWPMTRFARWSACLEAATTSQASASRTTGNGRP